jgi:hypothetical protein
MKVRVESSLRSTSPYGAYTASGGLYHLDAGRISQLEVIHKWRHRLLLLRKLVQVILDRPPEFDTPFPNRPSPRFHLRLARPPDNVPTVFVVCQK